MYRHAYLLGIAAELANIRIAKLNMLYSKSKNYIIAYMIVNEHTRLILVMFVLSKCI